MSEAPVKRRRLDSDDDEDEYAQPRRDSPLLQYAVTAALPTDEMALDRFAEMEEAHAATAEQRSVAPHADAEQRRGESADGADGRDDGDMGEAVGATSSLGGTEVPTGRPATTQAAPPASFAEDEDVPVEYRGLFSTELLNVLLVPLDSVCKQKAMTDKLLAQYLPQRAPQQGAGEYRNRYGIAPGFRWDGVVRGRGPVE